MLDRGKQALIKKKKKPKSPDHAERKLFQAGEQN